MKREFKVGDRVAVYSGQRRVGSVQDITNDGNIAVMFEGDSRVTYAYHPKQCRKLKVTKRKRRTYWIKKSLEGFCTSSFDDLRVLVKPGERVEFAEVPRKKGEC